jgi:hypothetical protein
MLCKDCTRRIVCKHYDYLLKAIELEIEINKCEHYSPNLSSYSVIGESVTGVVSSKQGEIIGKGRINMSDITGIVKLGGGEIKSHPNSLIDPNKGMNGLLNVDSTNSINTSSDGQNMARSLIKRDLKELSNELDPVNVDKPDDFKVTAMPTELAKCDNPECGADTYIEDKSKCTKCGKDVCPVCSVATMDKQMSVSDSGDDKSLVISTICEECWKATLNGPKPEKPKAKRGRPKKVKEEKTPDNIFGIEI